MRAAFVVAVIACVSGSSRGDEGLPVKVLEHIKRATVFVKVEADKLSGSGSGFLVKTDDNAAYLITNHHVVHPIAITATKVQPQTPVRPPTPLRPKMPARPPLPGRLGPPARGVPATPAPAAPVTVVKVLYVTNPKVSVVFFSASKMEKTVEAEIVGTDDVKDLAVLKISKFGGLPGPLDIRNEAEPTETMPVFFIGFPFGDELGKFMATKGNPAVSVGKASITSLPRNERGKLTFVVFDGNLNEGNSGGPVVDSRGRLVGVARSTILSDGASSGINKAVPVDEVARLFEGSVGSPHLRGFSKDNGQLKVKLEFDLIDLAGKIKSVALHYAPGENKTLSGKKTVPLKIERGKAAGEVVLPESAKNILSFQIEYFRGGNKPIFTDVRMVRLLLPASASPPPTVAANKPPQTPPPGTPALTPPTPTAPVSKLPPPKTPPPATQIAGLVGYWPFDGDDVVRLADQSGKDHTGSAEGLSSVAGIRGKAIQFSGANSFVDLGDSADFNFQARAPFSMACWVKSTTASGTVVSFRNSRDDGADIDITIEGGRLHATVRQDRGFFPAKIGGRFATNDNVWHHLALTREGNSISLFVDGQSQGTASSNHVEGAITSNWRFLGRERYWLNQGQQGFMGVKGHLEGALDEFCIFERALSHDEIRTLSGR